MVIYQESLHDAQSTKYKKSPNYAWVLKIQSYSCPQHEGMYEETEVHINSMLTLALATLLTEKNPVSIEWEAGHPQSWSGPFQEDKNILFLSGTEAWIIQPTA